MLTDSWKYMNATVTTNVYSRGKRLTDAQKTYAVDIRSSS